MKYEVFFEIYGKKMRVKTEAKTKEQAKENVKNAIKFYKVERESSDNTDFVSFFDSIVNPKS
jgi:predicted RNase H-like HicB family nuclease